MKHSRYLAMVLWTAIPAIAWSAAPAGYYDRCENRKGADLLEALCSTVSAHTAVGYDGLWDVYKTSDVYPEDGKVWDMYSTKHWTVNQNRCGNYKNVGDCYNREHSFPKSWFDNRSPMVSDAFHVYPTDGKVNGQRSNYPYGECASGTTLASSGGVRALGRLGSCTFPGYSGTVFEPDDQYKGDFARSYFYMAAAYNGYIDDWTSPMLAGNQYPVFASWAINLLMKWHREDPVSAKEIARNDAVYAHQKNRNPFIDHPELAEHIWGNSKNTPWTSGQTKPAEITLPVDGSTLDLGTVSTGHERSARVTVRGTALQKDAVVSVTGTGFSATPATLSAAAVNSVDGTAVTVSLTAQTPGQCAGTLTITSGDATTRVKLKATAVEGLPAGEAAHISDRSFTASWTYIGDADSAGLYTLHVSRADGTSEFSLPVDAHAEAADVDGLEPLTEYSYWITSQSLRSNTVAFTTRAPLPLIQLLYDGDLEPESVPGEFSPAYELLIDAENVAGDIIIDVTEPFYVSNDKRDWSERLVIPAEQERFYLCIYGDNPGTYSTVVCLTSGDYFNDETVVTGRIVGAQAFCEDFEADADGCDTYNGCNYSGTSSAWHLSDAGIWASDSKFAHSGKQAVRMGKSSGSYIEMTTDKPMGIGTVTLWACSWSDSEGAATMHLECSADHGATWQRVSTDTEVSGTTHRLYTFTVNTPGDCRLRLQQTAGRRWIVDDVAVTNYVSGIDGVESDYHSWDAFCRDGALVIESREPQTARVYGVDGIIYHNGPIPAGETTLRLPAGLYVVAIADFTRSVLVMDN